MNAMHRQMHVGLAAMCVVAMAFGQILAIGGSVPKATAGPTLYLPWESGSVWRITNGNGTGEHADAANQYAFDAVPDAGRSTTHVTAIAGGHVLGFQNDIPNDALFYVPHAGNCMLIQHDDGTVSIYAHLAAGSIPDELRQDGAEVRGGMVIGTVGDTGYARGVHLHWSLLSEGHMYDGGGYRTCAGTSTPSQYADNDRELIEDGGVPRTDRYYESTNVDQGIAEAPPVQTDDGMISVVSYDRGAAVDVAFGYLHEEEVFEEDSALFASRVLWAGGLPKSDAWTDDSTDSALLAPESTNPGPTDAAANANDLVDYLAGTHSESTYSVTLATRTQIVWSDNTASGAQLGDGIAYDWEGDGIIDHVAVVTNINASGYPEVSQHSPTQENQYWSYSEADHNWIEKAYPGSVAYLIHIDPFTVPNV